MRQQPIGRNALITIIIITTLLISYFLGFGTTGFVIIEDKPVVEEDVISRTEQGDSVRVIITKKESLQKALITTHSKETLKEELENLHITTTATEEELNMAVATIDREALEKLSKSRNLARIRVDERVTTFLETSTRQVKSYEANQLIIKGMNITGKGTTVCVIDTGIDYRHPSLGGCTQQDYNESNCSKVRRGINIIYGGNDTLDDNGHGTHVAGIIAGNGTVRGVAPEARLVAVKTLDYDGAGYVSDLTLGIQWCADHKETYNISVISISAGGVQTYASACDDTFPEGALAVNNAIGKNMSVVVATGNDGRYTGTNFPACLNKTIAVTSTQGNTTYATSANRGGDHDHLTAAPGTTIVSADLIAGSTTKSGTSMATPHVSGMIALLHQAYTLTNGNNLTDATVKTLIMEHSESMYDEETNNTYPFINAYQSVLAVDNTTPEATLETNASIIRKEHNESISIHWRTSSNHEYETNLTVRGPDNDTIMTTTNTTGTIRLNAQERDLGTHNISLTTNNTHGSTHATTLFYVKTTPAITILINDNDTITTGYPGTYNITVAVTGEAEAISLFINNQSVERTEAQTTILEEGNHTISATHEETTAYQEENETRVLSIINPLPVIINTTPEAGAVTSMENETINFSQESHNPLEGALNVTWEENETITTQETYLFNATNKKNSIIITLNVGNEEGNATRAWNITVLPVPLSIINHTPENTSLTIEHDETITFWIEAEDYLDRPVTYDWTHNSTITEEEQYVLNASLNEPGNHTITVEATNNLTTTHKTWNVTIMPAPYINFTATIANTTTLVNEEITLSVEEYVSYYLQGEVPTYNLSNENLTYALQGSTLSITPTTTGTLKTRVIARQQEIEAESNEFTITATQPPPPPAPEKKTTSGSSRGSSIIVSQTTEEEETIEEVIEEERTENKTRVRITSPTKEKKITIEPLPVHEEKEAAATFAGTTYSIYNISWEERPTTEEEPITIEFEVNVSWLEQEGLEEEDVAVYRYTDEWEELPTIVRERNNDTIVYEATTGGFSYFLIGTRTTKEAVEENPLNNTEEVREETITEEEYHDRNTSLILLASILTLVIILEKYYIRKKS